MEKFYEIQLSSGEILSKLTVQSVKEMAMKGDVRPTDRIKRVGSKTWHPLEGVHGIEFSAEEKQNDETKSEQPHEKEAEVITKIRSEYVTETEFQDELEVQGKIEVEQGTESQEDSKELEYKSDEGFNNYAVSEELQVLLDMTLEDIEQSRRK